MTILLTNDDGFDAEGIKKTKQILEKFGRVITLAPKEAMSAKSTSVTIGKPVQLEEIEKDIYSLSGTPADCVAFALSSLPFHFDLVVSGCNRGWNISFDIMYSGTIGACLEACTYGTPAIAFSCEDDFDLLEKHGEEVLNYIFSHHLLGKGYFLNVNFPLGNKKEDIRITNLYRRKTTTFYEKKKDGYYALRNLTNDYENYPGTDEYAVHHHIISVTPLNESLFNEEKFKIVKNKVIDI